MKSLAAYYKALKMQSKPFRCESAGRLFRRAGEQQHCPSPFPQGRSERPRFVCYFHSLFSFAHEKEEAAAQTHAAYCHRQLLWAVAQCQGYPSPVSLHPLLSFPFFPYSRKGIQFGNLSQARRHFRYHEVNPHTPEFQAFAWSAFSLC